MSLLCFPIKTTKNTTKQDLFHQYSNNLCWKYICLRITYVRVIQLCHEVEHISPATIEAAGDGDPGLDAALSGEHPRGVVIEIAVHGHSLLDAVAGLPACLGAARRLVDRPHPAAALGRRVERHPDQVLPARRYRPVHRFAAHICRPARLDECVGHGHQQN